MDRPIVPLDCALLLHAYAHGIFPMSDARDDPDTFWIEPRRRAILPLDGLHISRSLAKTVRQDRFRVTADVDFSAVIAHCAARGEGRVDTWINDDIEQAFHALHDVGMAHSIECWHGDDLVGGLYGLAMGRAFFGESMFSLATDASKVALVWLVARLRVGGFRLLDCQFMTGHLGSLGAIEISQSAYLEKLSAALEGYSAVEAAAAAAGGAETSAGAGFGDWGALDVALETAPPPAGAGASVSSPGKRILQSFTQIS